MKQIATAILVTASVLALPVKATLVEITDCSGANSCQITTAPPNPIVQDPNNGILLAWDEVQNYTLTEDLRVDRVFDTTASFITDAGGGDFFIQAGTIVSSHYLQWDPDQESSQRVQATVNLDSQVFAFITSDQNLFDSDEYLGLSGHDYSDFRARGLEPSDTTTFVDNATAINWRATSPGDWTRLITAYSPGGDEGGNGDDNGNGGDDHTTVPEPSAVILLTLGLAGLGFSARKKI
jgi:hypothetical protein